MSKKNKKPYFDAQEYVNQMLERRTNAALEQKNYLFVQEHSGDSNEELLDYVVQCAETLGYTPRYDEIIGGAFIVGRFGGWYKVLEYSGLPPMGKKRRPKGRRIYLDELRHQAALYRSEKRSKKQTSKPVCTGNRCQPEAVPETYKPNSYGGI